MGNLQKYADPLSYIWHQSQFQLAKKMTQRMTDIGIIPVLPAFTGFMPRTVLSCFPSAKFHYSSNWNDFGCNESCELDYLTAINAAIIQIMQTVDLNAVW
ncbi:unnamed protein product [Rotaria sordida]|uniref:Alpha-N-acetylglucosaminidase tim-barrel domain-containing protein n=1 Tax=Rotaria sordida TaxID=392033 RepID=A0A815CVD0_9BILA|nr:unnamed protein product [Rotaria sordida]